MGGLVQLITVPYYVEYINECKRKLNDDTIELLDSEYSNFNNYELNEVFAEMSERGQIKCLQKIWEKSGHMIELHANDESIFINSCANGHLEVAKWLWQISNRSINLGAQNEGAFRLSCNNGHLEVVKWLLALCYDNLVILNLIESDKYNEAIAKLNIKSTLTEQEHECMVCRDTPSEIIKLPRRHTFCSDSIVRFNLINNISVMRCFYCQREYQWDQCVASNICPCEK